MNFVHKDFPYFFSSSFLGDARHTVLHTLYVEFMVVGHDAHHQIFQLLSFVILKSCYEHSAGESYMEHILHGYKLVIRPVYMLINFDTLDMIIDILNLITLLLNRVLHSPKLHIKLLELQLIMLQIFNLTPHLVQALLSVLTYFGIMLCRRL